MRVSVTRFHVTQGDSTVKAFASVKLEEWLTIHGCRLLLGRNGLFVTMPSQKSQKDGKYYDHVTLVDQALKAEIAMVVIAHYESRTADATRGAGTATEEGEFFA